MTDRAAGHVAHLLPGYAAATLDADERDRVDRHLARCAACRAELAAWRVIGEAVRVSDPAPAVASDDERLLSGIWSRIDATAMQSGLPAPRRPTGGAERRVSAPTMTGVAPMPSVGRPRMPNRAAAAHRAGWLAPAARSLAGASSWLGAAALCAVMLFGIVAIYGGALRESVPAGPSGPRCGSVALAGGSPVPVEQAEAGPGTPAVPSANDNVSVAFRWQSTGGAGGFANVAGMAIDPECRLWVTDQLHGRFQIFSLDGVFLETWGAPGAAVGQFNFVVDSANLSGGAGGIAFAPDGGFYVLDAGNHRVQQFDAERRFVRAWGTEGTGDGQFEHAVGIALDRHGHVYVLDQARADVQVFSPGGDFLLKFGSPNVGADRLALPNALALDPSGNIWVADPDIGLHEFAPDGTMLQMISSTANFAPNGLAIDAAGNIYVGGDNRVTVYDAAGNRELSWGELGMGAGQFLEMSSLAIDGNGGVYVGELDNQRIQTFSIRPAP